MTYQTGEWESICHVSLKTCMFNPRTHHRRESTLKKPSSDFDKCALAHMHPHPHTYKYHKTHVHVCIHTNNKVEFLKTEYIEIC